MKRIFICGMSAFIYASLVIACSEEHVPPQKEVEPPERVQNIPTQIPIEDDEKNFLRAIVPNSPTFSDTVYQLNTWADIQKLSPDTHAEESPLDLEHYTYLAGIVYLPHSGMPMLSDTLIQHESYWEYNIVFQDNGIGYDVLDTCPIAKKYNKFNGEKIVLNVVLKENEN